MYRHILVATDGSELAGKAVSAGLALAKALGSKVTVVTVTEPWRGRVTGEAAFGLPATEFAKLADEQAAHVLEAVAAMAAEAGVAVSRLHVKDHYPADGVLRAAEDAACDLIVMASHGRRGLERLLLGSETVRVLTQSKVPVLVCR
ncbi:MAG: universal stress protein [Hyphomicrobiaceae bacterium]|nr:universal stress protein [Hyphomicrobiaceae bacterium]